MTDEEAVKAFEKEQDESIDDTEIAHGVGDEFVAQILQDHGFSKLAGVYRRAQNTWWYA